MPEGIADAVPFASSLCHRCAHLRLVATGKADAPRSVFLMCEEPTIPKYPPQPIRACHAHVPRPPAR